MGKGRDCLRPCPCSRDFGRALSHWDKSELHHGFPARKMPPVKSSLFRAGTAAGHWAGGRVQQHQGSAQCSAPCPREQGQVWNGAGVPAGTAGMRLSPPSSPAVPSHSLSQLKPQWFVFQSDLFAVGFVVSAKREKSKQIK